jgi:hypothetical protein
VITFPVGSRQDLQSRRLQGAVADRPGWRLGDTLTTNVPLTAQLYTACTRESCRFGMHMCAYASVPYFDTEAGGEWTWHIVDTRRDRPGSDIVRSGEPARHDPAAAVAAAETGLARYLATGKIGGDL